MKNGSKNKSISAKPILQKCGLKGNERIESMFSDRAGHFMHKEIQKCASIVIFDASIAIVDTSIVIVDANIAIIDASIVIVDVNIAIIDASIVIVDANIAIIDASIVIVDANIAIIDASIVIVDVSIAIIDAIIVIVDANIAIVDASIVIASAQVTQAQDFCHHDSSQSACIVVVYCVVLLDPLLFAFVSRQ